MAYHPAGRRWVKLWVQEWLQGSSRFELTIEQRAIFIDLLALAGQSRIPGTVCSGLTDDQKPRPYPLSWLAGNMICSEATLQTALDRCRDTGKLTYDLQPWDGQTCCLITLTNWTRYQSEYERQKKYRQKTKSDTQSDTADCPKVTHSITLQEGEGEVKKKKKIASSLRSDAKAYGEFNNVLLTDMEHQRLTDKFGPTLSLKIENLSSGIASKGYKYKNHYATLISWDRMEKQRGERQTPARPGPANRIPDRYPTPEELRQEALRR